MTSSSYIHLQKWYLSHCDGDWEHDERIKIQTLDNPGWRVWINIEDTELDGRVLDENLNENSEHDWLHFRSDGHVFDAACGPMNLGAALAAFQEFAGKHTQMNSRA